MIGYFYDNITKVFISDGLLQLDVLESKKQKKEIYLLPSNCTFLKPLATKKEEYNRWNGQSWELKVIEKKKEEEKKEEKKKELTFDELKKQKVKEIEGKVSEIIKSKYGSMQRQFNIINELGYKLEEKKEYVFFVNNIRSQENKFIFNVSNIKKLEDFEKFIYKFDIIK